LDFNSALHLELEPSWENLKLFQIPQLPD
jgi:hypothetical protein